MATTSAIKALIETRAKDLISDYQAWPKNMLRLELECLGKKRGEGVASGIYQDKTGDILKGLERAGEVNEFRETVNGTEHSFIAEPGCSTVGKEVKQRYERVDDFLEASGHFGALTAYVALCKVWEELANTHVDVYPEGSYNALHHVEREPDSFVIYPNEFIPIEVYNGRDYLDTPGGDYESEKYEQLYDYASPPPGYDINCHPFLINRRSTDDLKGRVRQWNGMVIDTDCIMACETQRSKIEDDLEFFEIGESVEFVPEFKASDGTLINGEDYANASPDSSLLYPTSAIADNASKIPSFYMERLRGGIQLHYVNSYYRRRHDEDSDQACRIIQEVYNQLLRQGGKKKQKVIDAAWGSVNFGDAIGHRRKQTITERVKEIIEELARQRIIYKRDKKVHARRAEHPQQGLVFEI